MKNNFGTLYTKKIWLYFLRDLYSYGRNSHEISSNSISNFVYNKDFTYAVYASTRGIFAHYPKSLGPKGEETTPIHIYSENLPLHRTKTGGFPIPNNVTILQRPRVGCGRSSGRQVVKLELAASWECT